jgi:hypothetical protein
MSLIHEMIILILTTLVINKIINLMCINDLPHNFNRYAILKIIGHIVTQISNILMKILFCLMRIKTENDNIYFMQNKQLQNNQLHNNFFSCPNSKQLFCTSNFNRANPNSKTHNRSIAIIGNIQLLIGL